ncbi:hypothetical protein DXG01_005171 [Tephrocybe rancida]|nr:hypothetical protein DXG01_005171 [Tephrocybe rancida]
MQSYINPLHMPVRFSRRSLYSSLDGAVSPTISQFLPVVLSPTRRRVPFQPYAPSSKFRQEMRRVSQLHSTITFDHTGYAKHDLPMRELVARSTSGIAAILQDAGDAVLVHTGIPRIRLRIFWPGYDHIVWVREIELNIHGFGPLTRAQLAAGISRHSSQFIETMLSTPLGNAAEWDLASSGIRFGHLVLLALVNVFEDVWQADVAIDLR